MSKDFPNDAEGDALRRIASHGSDLSKPTLFDFQVTVPDEAAAKNLARAAQKLADGWGSFGNSDNSTASD